MPYVIQNLDQSVLNWINAIPKPPTLTSIVQFITATGETGLIWILICLAMLFFPRTRKAGIIGLISLALGIAFSGILKVIIARPRPHFNVAVPETSYSFPSRHAATSFAAAVVFLRYLPKKFSIPLLCYAVIMALTRLYLLHHYPSDIIAGILLGALCAYAAEWIYGVINPKPANQKSNLKSPPTDVKIDHTNKI